MTVQEVQTKSLYCEWDDELKLLTRAKSRSFLQTEHRCSTLQPLNLCFISVEYTTLHLHSIQEIGRSAGETMPYLERLFRSLDGEGKK